MLFLQHLYNLSDPELEDQVNDRLSFQRFVGVGFTTTIPDYTTIWRFRKRLIEEKLNDKLFNKILSYLESYNLIIKKGTIVDATIIESSKRPLSKKKRDVLENTPSKQIDTDVGSKLIRRRYFSSANLHDSQFTENLLSGDEK